MLRSCKALLRQELQLAVGRPGELIQVFAFAALVLLLLSLALGPDLPLLKQTSGPMLWVAALLAHFLTLPRLLAEDLADGSAEQWLTMPVPLSLLLLIKTLAHWLTVGLPISLASPILGLMVQLPGSAALIVVVSLMLGTLAMSAVGAIAVALRSDGGFLLALLVLPLLSPVIIFGGTAVNAAVAGLSYAGGFQLLFAYTLAALALAPAATAFALKLTLQ